MAYWYHRNPLKATALVNFNIKMIVVDTEAMRVCGELKSTRNTLLETLSNPNKETTILIESLNNYLGLLEAFIKAPDDSNAESKLRYVIRFRWTQTLLGSSPLAQQDSVFELISILQNVGIWFMKHAAMIAGKDEITMDEAKEVHTCLRKAAGMFTTVRDTYLPELIDKGEFGSDLDPNIINTYIQQCTAEAQEITLARAVELKHAASLISALANETSKMFKTAAESLLRYDAVKASKWRKYLEMKSVFYLSFAYCYCGENLLVQEKCGDAVCALLESEKQYNQAEILCKKYTETKGVGQEAKVDQHLFFRKLGPVVKRMLDKCQRENGFIYHQKVPTTPPELELKATFGLASPEEFILPARNALWSPTAFAAFEGEKKNPFDPANSKSAQKAEGDLPPVKEAPVHQSNNAPKTSSGCVLQ